MAIIAYEENHLEQADWIDEDHLDLEGVMVPPEIKIETAMHVEEHLQCPCMGRRCWRRCMIY